MDKTIILENLDSHLFKKLKSEAKRQGKDLNTLLVQLLGKYFGIEQKRIKGNGKGGLQHLAGTWNAKEYKQFMQHTACFNEIDEQLWKLAR